MRRGGSYVSRGGPPGLHIFALHAVAVAAPLYGVLRRNREIFVAYRATPVDLLLLAAVVSLLLPLAAVLFARLAGFVSRPLQRAVVVVFIGLLAAAIASPLLARWALPAAAHVTAALLIGAGAAALYARYPVARSFLAFLSPAIIIVPAVLLLHPSMRPLLFPDDPADRVAGNVDGDTPIVLVVFDQLPLNSLLTVDGRIDAAHYPGFAALASESTWFRRATTVADLTGWALPPIVSGRYPRPGRLPIAEDHPDNLFTFLARSHRMEVFEPITALCPRPICDASHEPLVSRVSGMLLDSAVVYAYVIAPPSLASALPPLTENWRGFIAAQRWQQRWISERDADRRDAPNAFLAGIDRTDPQPTLYFLHALLPHEPYMYLPSGQRFTDQPRLIGLQSSGRWVNNLWPVTQAYATELLQVGFVDRFVSRLVQRLRDEGLYDRALLIVTADHGVSFRPGLTFKGINNTTIRDITPVPLLVKLPFQREGTVSDRNVQSIDVVPLVADVLQTQLTWKPQGISPLGREVPAPPVKTIFYAGATQRLHITPENLHAEGEAVRRRVDLLGGEEVVFRTPRMAPHRELVGRATDDLDTDEETSLRVVVEQPRQWLDVDLEGDVIPSLVSGRVTDERRQPASAVLAIAVNGRIEATTKTYDAVPGYEGFWSALVDPRMFRKGPNVVDVFIVRDGGAAPALTRAFSTALSALASINLISEEAQTPWEARLSGFHLLEGTPGRRFRWTTGAAAIVMPLPSDERPRSLRVGLAPIARSWPLRLTYNGCVVFNGKVPGGGYYTTVSLDGCPETARASGEARIEIDSPAFQGPRSDPRTLGLPIETLRLSSEVWPLLPEPSSSRGRMTVAEPRDTATNRSLATGTAVLLEITNRGERAWASTAEAPTERPVRIVSTWRRAADAEPLARDTIDLPRVLYTNDVAQVWLRLDPPPAVQQSGAAAVEVSFEIVEGDRPLDLVSPGAARVRVSIR